MSRSCALSRGAFGLPAPAKGVWMSSPTNRRAHISALSRCNWRCRCVPAVLKGAMWIRWKRASSSTRPGTTRDSGLYWQSKGPCRGYEGYTLVATKHLNCVVHVPHEAGCDRVIIICVGCRSCNRNYALRGITLCQNATCQMTKFELELEQKVI